MGFPENNIEEVAADLAEMWTLGRIDEFEAVFEKILDFRDPDEVFRTAVGFVSSEKKVDFRTDIFSLASNVQMELVARETNLEVMSDTDFFAIVVQGTAEEAERFGRNAVLGEVVQQIEACGLIHENASVIISGVPLDLEIADRITPAQVREITDLFSLMLITGEASECDPAVRKILDLSDEPGALDNVQNPSQMVSRLFLGARMLPRPTKDVSDLLDPPLFLGNSEVDNAILEEHFLEVSRARDMFSEAASKVCAAYGVQVRVGGPFEWPQSLGAISLAHLSLSVHYEAHLNGCDIASDRAKEGHFGFLKNEIVIAVKKDDVLIGPIGIPLSSAMHGIEDIMDWLKMVSGKVFKHEDGNSVLGLREVQGMRLH